jgi:TRAP-type C4-dicarboxylate transport system substrate-binding protein
MGPKIALAAAAVAALPFTAQGQPVQLKLASTAPPISLMNPRIFQTWIDDVEKDSNGAVKIQLYVGNSVATVYNVYDRTVNHVVDIGWAPFGPITNQFPKTTVVSLPFAAEDHNAASYALQRIYENGTIADEHTAVHVLNLFVFPGTVLHLNKPTRNIAELKGQKISVEARVLGDMLERLGAVPIPLAPPDMHQAAQRGVVDGIAIGWVAVGSFKVDEVTKYHLDVVLNATPAYIYMNKDSYAKLPEAARKAIDKHSGEAFTRRINEVLTFMDTSQLERVSKAPGQTVAKLDPAELARWKEMTRPIEQQWVASTPDGAKVLAAYRAELAKQEKKP